MDTRDPQQFLIYRMEREEIGCRDYARLTLPECKRLGRSVCRQYGVPQARIQRKKLRRWAAEWDNGTITLNPDNGAASDLLTILHELAHHVHFHLANRPDSHEDHGPEFMACYISILDTVRFIPMDAMATLCERRKLRYLLPGASIKTLKTVLNRESRTARARRLYAGRVRQTARR